MKRWPRNLLHVLMAAAGVIAVTAGARAETCTLEMKRLDPLDQARIARGEMPPDFLYRTTSPQHFFMQILSKELVLSKELQEKDPRLAAFARIVKKEPAKYESDSPCRFVAKLGGEEYAFVLDKKDVKSKGYDRLYFDADHNGDLTDDKVLDGDSARSSAQYSSCEFPRVDVTLNVDGTKLDYRFSLNVYTQTAGDFKFASVSLNAGAYREGEITLEGKKRRIVLLDYNSNGRFDDPIKVRDTDQVPNGEVYPELGDMLLVDPDPKAPAYPGSYRDVTAGGNRHHVSKSINIEGRYYELKVAPTGETLTLTPSKAPLGYVTSPHEGMRAVLYGDQGFVVLQCGKSGPAAVPEGKWNLLSYTIDRTGWEEPPPPPAAEKGKPAEETDEKPKGEKSILSALLESIFGSREETGTLALATTGPRYTLVSASATKACPVVKVGKAETVALPFGPPYKPAVIALPGRDSKEARLQMSLAGAAGERCSDLTINGSRPPAPKFTILGPKDEVVAKGTFGWG